MLRACRFTREFGGKSGIEGFTGGSLNRGPGLRTNRGGFFPRVVVSLTLKPSEPKSEGSMTRDSHNVMGKIAERQGWNDETCLTLATSFIAQNEKRLKEFQQHLEDVATEENEVGDLWS